METELLAGARARLPHARRRRHGGVPGRGGVPPVHRHHAGRRAHAAPLRGARQRGSGCDEARDRHGLHAGSAEREAPRRRRGRLRGRRAVRERPDLFRRQPEDVKAEAKARSASRSSRSSRSATSRACRSRRAHARLRAREPQVRPDGPPRRALAPGLQQHLARGERRDRPHRGRPARPRRARRRVRRQGRLRGARLGPPRQRLPPGLGGGRARRARAGRRDPRQLPHAGAAPADGRMAQIPAERIALVQVADAPGIAMDLLFLSRHFRCFPGQGDLPVVAMLQALRATGYDGWLSHEIFSDDFRAASTRRIAIDGMRSFLWLDEQQSAAAEPSPPVDRRRRVHRARRRRQPPKRRPRPRAARPRLPPHPSPPLQAGRALSPGRGQPRGQSRGRGLLPRVLPAARPCGRRDRAARRRCRGYGGARQDMLASPFVGPIGKGELKIPAVRGVAGSLLYLIDRPGRRGAFFDVDFVPDAEAAAPPAPGLERIDHIAQVVAEAELPGWVLYYRSILGLEPAERTDLTDPHGLIVSRALPMRRARCACRSTPRAPTARRPGASCSRPRAPARSTSRLPAPTSSRRRQRCPRPQAAGAGQLLRGPRRALRARRRRCSPACRRRASSTTGSARASSSTSTRARSTACSSRSSSAAAATTATARPTPRSASPPRPRPSAAPPKRLTELRG